MGHPKITEKFGIGMRKPLGTPRKGLKPRSEKQAVRTEDLKDKLETLLQKQMELYGTTRCEAGFAGWNGKCPPGSPLVVDHVNTRNIKDPDRLENLQVVCWAHNGVKGSKRLNFRPQIMIDALKELDNKGGL